MLNINQLSITNLKDSKQMIADLNLIVNSGEKLAIIGEEGTGKSTLLQAIANSQMIASYANLEGQIQNNFKKVGYLPQSLAKEERSQTISDFLYKDIDSFFNYNAFYQMAALLHLDLSTLENNNQSLANLSGGERIKLQLTKLTGQEPDLFLLDEPSSDLDIEGQNLLKDFIQNTDKTVIFISHDEAILEDTATAILHLELIRKRQIPRASYFQGNYNDYLKQRKKNFIKQYKEAKNAQRLKKKRDEKIRRLHQAAQYNVRHTHDSTLGRLAAKKMKNVLSLEKRYEKEDKNLTEFPENMDSIKLFFHGISPIDKKKRLLSWHNQVLSTGQTIDLDILGQDKIVITGKNGIGKTRLLKQIYRELSRNKQLSIGYMPQDYDNILKGDISAVSFLSEVTTDKTARTILASLQFTKNEMEHSIIELSGGQKAKIFLARMVLAKNHIIILDEVTRHFSPTSQSVVRQLLRDYPGCIISVSHDQNYINNVVRTHYQLTSDTLQKH
ncbi:ABC-F family ATP-binding cassette domain-containing protein [Streptococcus sp. SL1232]|nr:ATP-binding cassette domain-containing protein [Streptococcus vicugnae]MBJ7540220.1 ABC-F family ATP-binding cassette domain-containing protein [Streptococcus vicugnae]